MIAQKVEISQWTGKKLKEAQEIGMQGGHFKLSDLGRLQQEGDIQKIPESNKRLSHTCFGKRSFRAEGTFLEKVQR